MIGVVWALLAAAAVLWPGRLAGPLDGAPLDQPAEVVVIALLAWAACTHARFLRERAVRWLVVALLVWKAATGAVLVQEGLCVRFTTPVSIYMGDVLVPHSWDVRADWRSPVPRCAAVMTAAYPELERFPAWFFNLPPADPGRAATPADRPPNVTTDFDLDGYLRVNREGTFRLLTGEDVHAVATLDNHVIGAAQLERGIILGPGLHQVIVRATLVKSHWSLTPLWNNRDLFATGMATLAPPSTLDGLARPWGRWVATLLVLGVLLAALASIARRARSPIALVMAAGLTIAAATIAWTGSEALMRAVPLLLLVPLVVKLPRRIQNMFGASLLVGLPFLGVFLVLAARQAGIFTWYSSGDDWWMFQRYAYRVFLEGYWLEGGEKTFWFQPLYRWIAGTLHMLFGDSSAGELLWDAGGAVVGALFAFHVTRKVGGFRWGLAAAVVTLATFTLGPTWHLFGRGLSEFSSAGFLYAAALLALRARHRGWPPAIAAGVLATLGFYTRLNNLPVAVAVAVFSLPLRVPVMALWTPKVWMRQASRIVICAVLGAVSLGLWLFTARTYYYTHVPSMLFGTTAVANSVWLGGSAWQAVERLMSSLLMILTMNDPPQFDVRALVLIAGFVVAVLGVAGNRRVGRVPLNVALFCLSGVVGAFVARAHSYPARFSIHLIPVTVALFMCALSLLRHRHEAGIH